MPNIAGHCSQLDCTATETGICLIGRPTPQKCEHFTLAEHEPVPDSAEAPAQQSAVRSFYSGSELGTKDTLAITRTAYTHVVGILGPYDAGKTCFLLSLYLMASRRLLPDGCLFKGSLTLQAFEDRARRLKKWRGGPLPAQLADHTSSVEPRRPGFLHLSLASEEEPLHLLLPDLPGEWTTNLIQQESGAERWEFLQRADGLVVVLDGLKFSTEERYVYVTKSKHLLERLRDSVKVPLDIPMVLLLSKADELKMQVPPTVTEVEAFAVELGYRPKIIMCASFSRDPERVNNGTGVYESIMHVIESTPPSYFLFDPPRENKEDGRAFASYRYAHE